MNDDRDNNPYESDSFEFQEPVDVTHEAVQPLGVLTPFEKVCAVLAFVFAIPLLVLGIMGLFIGCAAHFTLPPILGVFPAFIAWGIMRPIYKVWRL